MSPRKQNEPYSSTKTVKFVCKSLIFWRYIINDGSRKLVEIDGDLYFAKYIQLLNDNLIPDFDEGEIFKMI